MSKYDSNGEITFDEASAITVTDHIVEPPPGMDGLDELAAELGVEPGGSNTITLQGKGGDWYDWIAILEAHIKRMRST